MVIKMNKNMNKNIKLSIIIIVVAVFMVIISIAYRKASYTQSWLVCNMDYTEKYHEILKFRYDINDKMYGYYREESLSNLTPELLQSNLDSYNQFKDKYKEELDDNFSIEISTTDTTVLVKTYIGVSVYPNFFNKYFNNDNIKSSSNINDLKTFLESKGYKCEISRK